jgi:hypothetical protein
MHYALCTMHYARCTMHAALCTMHYALCTLTDQLSPINYQLLTINHACLAVSGHKPSPVGSTDKGIVSVSVSASMGGTPFCPHSAPILPRFCPTAPQCPYLVGQKLTVIRSIRPCASRESVMRYSPSPMPVQSVATCVSPALVLEVARR